MKDEIKTALVNGRSFAAGEYEWQIAPADGYIVVHCTGVMKRETEMLQYIDSIESTLMRTGISAMISDVRDLPRHGMPDNLRDMWWNHFGTKSLLRRCALLLQSEPLKVSIKMSGYALPPHRDGDQYRVKIVPFSTYADACAWILNAPS